MKLSNALIVVCGMLPTTQVTSFTVPVSQSGSSSVSTALRSAITPSNSSPIEPVRIPPEQPQKAVRNGDSNGLSQLELSRLAFPMNMPLTRIEGGNTVRTWQIPLDVERAQVFLKTNGRPMKAKVELWVGPIRTVHTMDMDVEDGEESVYRALLKFKKAGPTLRIITSEDDALPVLAGVQVLPPEKSDLVASFTEQVWKDSPKTKIQGGPTTGGNGAVRVFPIDASVDQVQLVFWSKDTSKKSLKAKIELLQGPNNYKQVYDLQCGGGSQPFHLVLDTPGAGWVIRIYNKKFVEDGLFEVAVVPFVTGNSMNDEKLLKPDSVIKYPAEGVRRGPPMGSAPNPYRQKPWWE
jgi:hypothetical protein